MTSENTLEFNPIYFYYFSKKILVATDNLLFLQII